MSRLSTMMETGPTIQVDQPLTPDDDARLLNRLAVLVGSVAIGLPIVLWVGANLFNSCMRYSISHFYYAQFLGAIFVGSLFFIGAFLIAYSVQNRFEDWGSNVAGLGAFAVALFPTTGDGCDQSSFLSRVFVTVNDGAPHTVAPVPDRGFFTLFETVSDWHMWGAGIVFVYLGIYCLIFLKRIIPERHMINGKLKQTKARRNRYYSWCGIVILSCVAVLAIKGQFDKDALMWWNQLSLTFYVEAIALWAFGLSWFIKGRAFKSLNDS